MSRPHTSAHPYIQYTSHLINSCQKGPKVVANCLGSHRCGSSKLSCTYNSATCLPAY